MINFRAPDPITKTKELEDYARKEQLRQLPRKGFIPRRSEESQKSMITRVLRFFASEWQDGIVRFSKGYYTSKNILSDIFELAKNKIF